MLNLKLANKFKKASTNTMTNTLFARDLATLFMFHKNKFNNYNLKH